MVWIHGGGFVLGSGSLFDGTDLASKGVVVITINYRLGVYGFLSTEDDAMPGNYGMMDQIMALKWVKAYVQSFGGDSGDVTIIGQSAGSDSVSLLCLSPLSKGLFHKAIMESGVSITTGTVFSSSDMISPLTFAKLLSSSIGCHQHDSKSMLTCLQGIDDGTTFQRQSLAISFSFKKLFSIIKPRVERVYGFISGQPLAMIENGDFMDVPTLRLRGFTSDEFGKFISDPEDDGISYEEFKNVIKSSFSAMLYGFYELNHKEIDRMYKVSANDSLSLRSSLIALLGDMYFALPTVKETDLLTEPRSGLSSKQFVYSFGYRASFVQTPVWKGADHGAEIPFVFGLVSNTASIANTRASTQDLKIEQYVENMWINFAKFGSPNSTSLAGVEWKAYTYTERNMLLIGNDLKSSTFSDFDRLRMFTEFMNYTITSHQGDPSIVGR